MSIEMSYQSSFSFIPGEGPDNDPDLVYYNATIINNRTDVVPVDSIDPQIRFQETRSIPIIRDASRYQFSIVRFTMSGPNKDLPLFIPVIRTGASNPTNDVNKTIYSITLTMRKNGQTYTSGPVPITYVSETQDSVIAPVPLASTIAAGEQDLSTRYYWVYTYGHWLDLVNAAFAQAAANVATAYGGAVVTKPPIMTYEPTTNLFSILSDTYGYGGADRRSAGLAAPADEEWNIFFNSDMFGLFTNFNNLYVNGRPTGSFAPLTLPLPEATNQILIQNIAGQNIVNTTLPWTTPAPATPDYFWKTTQTTESTSSIWSPIESIVFTSALLPLVNEATGDPVTFGQSNLGIENQSTQSAFQPIITDIALPIQNASNYREFIEYAPVAEYRMASFQRSKQPINSVDIQVYWKNRLDGNLYPVNMFNSSSVTVKILFRRRAVYDAPHRVRVVEDM